MKEEIKNQNLEIDLIVHFKKIWLHKKIISITCIIFFICGIIIAYSIPKSYKVEVTLSLESGITNNNNLAGMASMLGLGSIGNNSQDALNSTMFPEIIKTTPFILEMYHINVTPNGSNNPIKLSQYISQEKKPWWNAIIAFPNILLGKVKSFFSPQSHLHQNETTINPYKLTEQQKSVIKLIKNSLSAKEDKKSGLTIISATLQDPDITAAVADSAVSKLQKYIIDYKTRKAQDDANFLEKLCKERKEEYLITQKRYANFVDANRNVILQRTQVEGKRLENDMNIAFQIYSQVETQLQIARAKVQESKPVYAIVEPASIPLWPSSPNKLLIIGAFLFLGFISSSVWVLLGKDIWSKFKKVK